MFTKMIKTTVLLTTLLLPIISLASAKMENGGSYGAGNGGGVHVCPDSIEFYDLYEGKQPPLSLDIPLIANKSEEEISKMMIDKIYLQHPILGNLIEREYKQMKKNENIDYYLEGKSLRPIADANFIFTNKGCSYKQLGNWIDTNNFPFIDNDYFCLMDEMNRSAFFLHEAAYKVARLFRAKNSDDVRQFIAEVFSTNEKVNHLLINIYSPFKDMKVNVGSSVTKRGFEKNHIVLKDNYTDITNDISAESILNDNITSDVNIDLTYHLDLDVLNNNNKYQGVDITVTPIEANIGKGKTEEKIQILNNEIQKLDDEVNELYKNKLYRWMSTYLSKGKLEEVNNKRWEKVSERSKLEEMISEDILSRTYFKYEGLHYSLYPTIFPDLKKVDQTYWLKLNYEKEKNEQIKTTSINDFSIFLHSKDYDSKNYYACNNKLYEKLKITVTPLGQEKSIKDELIIDANHLCERGHRYNIRINLKGHVE